MELDGQVVGYVYDADGLRVERHVDGSLETRYVLDTATRHAQVVAELDERGAVTAGYVHGHGPIRQQAGAVRYPVQDGQGSVRLLTGPEGAVSDTFDFDAFGVLLARTGLSDAPYGYVREVRDPSTGLYDLRARWLDSALGRFLGEDPVQPVSRAPLTLHRYAYALNDPVNRWDPSGRFSAALMAPVGMLQIISIVAIQSLLPFVITVGVIDRLMKPGFALRYGAMELLSASDHPGVYRYAMRMYRMGGQLIGAGGGLIRLTFSVYQFAHNFRLLAKSIRGIVTDWGSWPAAGVWAVGIGVRLSNLDRAAGGLDAGFTQLARAIRQRHRRQDSRLDDLVGPLTEDLHAYFGTARSLLLSGR